METRRNKRSRRNSYSDSSAVVPFRRYKSPFLRMMSQRALGSRVHTFKRVGEPIILSASAGVLSITGPLLPVVQGGTGFITLGSVAADQANLNQCVQFGAALRFSLSQCSNVGEITSLFENYRIKKVKLAISLSTSGGSMADNATLTNALGLGPTTSANPLMHMCPDVDDNVAPTLTSVLQNSLCESRRLDSNIIYKTIVPRAQTAVAQASTSGGTPTTLAGGLLSRSTWLDANSPDVSHYGYKMFFQNWFQHPQTGFQFALTITPTYIIEAKNVI